MRTRSPALIARVTLLGRRSVRPARTTSLTPTRARAPASRAIWSEGASLREECQLRGGQKLDLAHDAIAAAMRAAAARARSYRVAHNAHRQLRFERLGPRVPLVRAMRVDPR